MHSTHAGRAFECQGWACTSIGTVEEIKELPSRWKGLLHGFQTTREEGGEKTKTLAGETKNRKEEKTIQHQKEKAKVRTEEKIGKRAIRKKNNRKKPGKEKEQTRACGRSGGAGTERSKYKSQS